MGVVGKVNTELVGTYTLMYRAQDKSGNWNDGKCKGTNTCVNHRGYPARPAIRSVIVQDTTCPVCYVRGGPATVEAGFPYSDKGAYFTDSVDGKFTKNVQVVGKVNTELVGTYTLMYRAQDKSGNWNDGKCKGTNTCQRKVKVIGTLKPVIALKYGGKNIHVSRAGDHSKSDVAHANPAAKYFS